MRNRLAAWSFLLAGIAASGEASAFLEGQQFYWRETSDHPLGGGADSGGVVGPGIDHYGAYYTVDITDTGLSMQFLSGHSFANLYPQINGFNLSVFSPWANTGLSVGVVSSPWASFGDANQYRLLVEPATLRIDFGGLTVNAGDTLVLSMAPLGAVPEPAPAALLAAGLAVLAWTAQGRRRRARAVQRQAAAV